MRVLVLTSMYPNPYRPHKAPWNRHQLARLARRCPVAVVAPVPWVEEARGRKRGAPPLPADRRVELDGMEVEHPRFHLPFGEFQDTCGVLLALAASKTFLRRVDEFRPDVVFAPWAYPDGWAAVRLARQVRLPVVLQVRGPDVRTRPGAPELGRRPFGALRAADGVVAVSENLAQRVREKGGAADRVRVIYDGVDSTCCYPGPRADARARLGIEPGSGPLVVCVGDQTAPASTAALLDACDRLARSGVRFITRIVGRGPIKRSLQRNVAALGLTDRIDLVGGAPEAVLSDWYRAADVFVLAGRPEGVPNVLLDASACGARCVAFRWGGMPEVAARANVILVSPDAPAGLAGGILAALSAHNLTPPVPRSWAESAEELEQFLLQFTDRAPRPLIRHRQG